MSTARVGLTRDEIIDAALAMLEREDPASFTMRRLASEMGVTTPTVYWHVGSRDQVLDAALERFARLHHPRPPSGGTAREQMVDVLRQMFEGGVRHPHMTRLSFDQRTSPPLSGPWESAIAGVGASAGLNGARARKAIHGLMYTVGGLVTMAIRDEASNAPAASGSRTPRHRQLTGRQVFELVVPPLVDALIPADPD